MSEKIVLFDGHSILNRAFYGIRNLTNDKGLPTNAVYGFLNIMQKILAEEEPQYLAVAFDVHAPTFRHEMYAAYKGTRKPMPPELRTQVPMIKDVLRAMGVAIVEQPGYEADDILGTLGVRAEQNDLEVRIISGDRDLLQLATEHTMIRIPKTDRGGTHIENYYAADVQSRYQVTPSEFIDVKALMGDTADNIPGIPGIGEKTATSLIVQYHSIENVYAHREEIRPERAKKNIIEYYEQAVLSKRLATIDVHAPVEMELSAARRGDFYTPEAYALFQELNFKNMLAQFPAAIKQNREKTPEVAICKNKAEIVGFLEKLPMESVSVLADVQQTAEPFSQPDGQMMLSADGLLPGQACGFAISDGREHTAYLSIGSEDAFEAVSAYLLTAERIVSPDVKKLLRYLPKLEGKIFFDTTIAAYLLDPLKSSYAYDDIAREYGEISLPSYEDLFGRVNEKKARSKEPEKFEQMLAYQAFAAAVSLDALLSALDEKGMRRLYDEIEMPLCAVLASMENEGVHVDAQALKNYGIRLGGQISDIEKRIYDQAGETFNINSPKQLGVILFEKMGLPGGKKTKTGYSTAADVLEKLAGDFPIVADILEYRQLTKLKSTYADGLAAYIEEDGRIRTNFQQTVTATGRLSSTEPNLQNIPVRMEIGRQIRKVFIPRDGCCLIDADYSQIELRVLAHMSGDEQLIEAYHQDKDIHRITASQVFHVPFDEVTALQRRNAKAVNFGIVYGISSFGLSQDLSITRTEAQEYIENYFQTYPDVRRFLNRLVAEAKETGYAITLFGRRRPVPELASSNYMQRQLGERIAMNSPIQGTAADIIKIAMIRVAGRLRAEGLSSKLILQVHDELLIEAKLEEAEAVCRILSEEMQAAATLRVALEIDTKIGANWYEAH